MFGKRSATSEQTRPPVPRPASPRPAAVAPPHVEPQGAALAPPPVMSAQGLTVSKAHARTADPRSDEYYQIKTTIFSALIDTIDLAQLAQLDAESAREEIRDIVNEIISIKAVVMSIAEQESLLQDICNDVLGYGPLEPLLARDDISDIMVNGANRVFIEVEWQNPAHTRPLPRQCAADEHLPAHRQPGRAPRRRKLAHLRRASSRRQPRQRHRARRCRSTAPP